MPNDPYRILGLEPTASAAEIKHAYRSLAKANHPDFAGEKALPRFLAIQAAYEQLTASQTRLGGRSRAGSSSAATWKTDPARAGEARDRSRTGETRDSGPTAREAGARARSPGPDGPRRPDRPPGPDRPPSGRRGSRDEAGGSSGTPGSARRKSARKATFGSTTYDEAHDPADPAWQGASWYGQSSGEYWTVNPREYADPRKHGPEYQARAAERAARAEARAAEARAEPQAEAHTAEPSGPNVHGDATGPHRDRADAAAPAGAGRQARPRAAAAAQRAAEALATAGTPSNGAEWSTDETSAPGMTPLAFGPGLVRFGSGPFRRMFLALVAWPPLGIAAAALIGEATGCAIFSAGCTSVARLYPWVAQVAIIAALALTPRVARVLVGGTAAVAILALPVAVALSAGGASYDPTYGPASLVTVLALGWVAGVGLMVLRALRTLRMRS